MRRRLSAALEAIRTQIPGSDGRLFSDTSPVLERSYARAAGLGWIAKNTMLIHPRRGSFFFLGGIALNLELIPAINPPPAANLSAGPSKDHCGACTRCIEACPTQALKPYEMEATRCISYLTIEKKSLSVPEDLQKGMGPWIFGCDLCQEVCPFNGGKDDSQWTQAIPPDVPLKRVLGWEEKDYRQYFKGTPVLRAKWLGFLKNAVIAAGNSGDPALAAPLENLLTHPSPEIQNLTRHALLVAPQVHEGIQGAVMDRVHVRVQVAARGI
jgi:epoxyqueuosine reductase